MANLCVDSLSSGLVVSSKLGVLYGGGWFYLYRPWSSPQILSGKGANNGQFERG